MKENGYEMKRYGYPVKRYWIIKIHLYSGLNGSVPNL